MKSGDARVALVGFPSVGKVLEPNTIIIALFRVFNLVNFANLEAFAKFKMSK